jgi:hypothetical protein
MINHNKIAAALKESDKALYEDVLAVDYHDFTEEERLTSDGFLKIKLALTAKSILNDPKGLATYEKDYIYIPILLFVKVNEELRCQHCGRDKRIRNPSGECDHLYYPNNCATCKEHEIKNDV